MLRTYLINTHVLVDWDKINAKREREREGEGKEKREEREKGREREKADIYQVCVRYILCELSTKIIINIKCNSFI